MDTIKNQNELLADDLRAALTAVVLALGWELTRVEKTED